MNHTVLIQCLPKNGLALYNKPIFLAILFLVYLICSFEDKCSSNKTPKNFIYPTLIASLSLISTLESKSGRSSALFGWWNREYFVLSAFNESLFSLNYS